MDRLERIIRRINERAAQTENGWYMTEIDAKTKTRLGKGKLSKTGQKTSGVASPMPTSPRAKDSRRDRQSVPPRQGWPLRGLDIVDRARLGKYNSAEIAREIQRILLTLSSPLSEDYRRLDDLLVIIANKSDPYLGIAIRIMVELLPVPKELQRTLSQWNVDLEGLIEEYIQDMRQEQERLRRLGTQKTEHQMGLVFWLLPVFIAGILSVLTTAAVGFGLSYGPWADALTGLWGHVPEMVLAAGVLLALFWHYFADTIKKSAAWIFHPPRPKKIETWSDWIVIWLRQITVILFVSILGGAAFYIFYHVLETIFVSMAILSEGVLVDWGLMNLNGHGDVVMADWGQLEMGPWLQASFGMWFGILINHKIFASLKAQAKWRLQYFEQKIKKLINIIQKSIGYLLSNQIFLWLIPGVISLDGIVFVCWIIMSMVTNPSQFSFAANMVILGPVALINLFLMTAIYWKIIKNQEVYDVFSKKINSWLEVTFDRQHTIVYFSRGGGGGLQRHVLQLAGNLSPQKFRIIIFIPLGDTEDKFFDDRKKAEGNNVIIIELPKTMFHFLAHDYQWVISLPMELFYLTKLMLLINPDVVHIHGILGLLGAFVGRFLGIPIVYTGHSDLEFWRFLPLSNIGILKFRFAIKAAFKMAKSIIAFSDEGRDKIRKAGLLSPSKVITVLRHGIDTKNLLDPNESRADLIRKELGLKENSIVLCVLGGLKKVKGHKYLIETLKKINAIEFRVEVVIVGDGPLADVLRMQVKNEGLDNVVKFVGWREDIPEVLTAIDALILPSLSEISPYVVKEAMAAGKLVIATPVGDVPNLIEDGKTGIIVETRSPEDLTVSLCGAILGFIEMTVEEREMISKAGQEKVLKEFTLEEMITQYGQFYSKLINQTRRKSGLSQILARLFYLTVWFPLAISSCTFRAIMEHLKMYFFEDSVNYREVVHRESKQISISEDFDNYLIENGEGNMIKLSDYKYLYPLVSLELREMLLKNPILRPVFLLVLPKRGMVFSEDGLKIGDDVEILGPWEGINQELVNQIGGIDVLDRHSVFLPGSPELANKMAGEGHEFVVAVTDKPSDDTLLVAYKVANARKAYCRLSGLPMLGIKGPGQFKNAKKPPHFFAAQIGSDGRPSSKRHQGLELKRRAEWAYRNAGPLGAHRDLFSTLIAYRCLYAAPDGKGNLVTTDHLTDPSYFDLAANPVLVLTRSLIPERLLKLIQVLRNDPGLKKMTQRVSQVLLQQRSLDSEITSASDLMLMIARKMGAQEAIKANHGVIKISFHIQDIEVTGLEHDDEETLTYDEYLELSLIYKSVAMRDENFELVRKHKIGIGNLRAKILIWKLMMLGVSKFDKEELQKQFVLLFPSPLRNLEEMFRSYFRSLNLKHLILWTQDLNYDLHPLCATIKQLDLSIFHPNSFSPETAEDRLSRQVADLILGWAREEVSTRKKNLNNQLVDKGLYLLKNFKELKAQRQLCDAVGQLIGQVVGKYYFSNTNPQDINVFPISSLYRGTNSLGRHLDLDYYIPGIPTKGFFDWSSISTRQLWGRSGTSSIDDVKKLDTTLVEVIQETMRKFEGAWGRDVRFVLAKSWNGFPGVYFKIHMKSFHHKKLGSTDLECVLDIFLLHTTDPIINYQNKFNQKISVMMDTNPGKALQVLNDIRVLTALCKLKNPSSDENTSYLWKVPTFLIESLFFAEDVESPSLENVFTAVQSARFDVKKDHSIAYIGESDLLDQGISAEAIVNLLTPERYGILKSVTEELMHDRSKTTAVPTFLN